jgi:hypothetical protein
LHRTWHQLLVRLHGIAVLDISRRGEALRGFSLSKYRYTAVAVGIIMSGACHARILSGDAQYLIVTE